MVAAKAREGRPGTQVVTQRRSFWCGRCNHEATLTPGKEDRLTFLVCPRCGVEEAVLSQAFGHMPFEIFDMRIETTGVQIEYGT